jgi:large subunit ribosomal protein L21
LFAIVWLAGTQYKITTEDVILVRDVFYPTVGDKIRLEKVLLVGGKDFTIVGKPLVDKRLVRVEATVIEKTISNDIIRFTYKPRKDNRHWAYEKRHQTLLRINNIEFSEPIASTNN